MPDAGTYWYHPHAHSAEQVGRGLMGALIIEEPEPPPVDRDVVWVLGDFRLKDDASIAGGFDNRWKSACRGGSAIRSRSMAGFLIAFRFGPASAFACVSSTPRRHGSSGLNSRIIARSSSHSTGSRSRRIPRRAGGSCSGRRCATDLILDMTGNPGTSATVLDTFYKGLEYKLVEIAYRDEPPLRAQPLDPPKKLPPNPIPEPDLATAQRHDVSLTGGMMGGMGMGGGGMGRMGMGGSGMGMGGGMMRGGMMGGSMWAINGMAVMHDDMRNMKPVLMLKQGKSYVLAIDNRTAWHHPMHMHGHSFRRDHAQRLADEISGVAGHGV